ncbi:unnamed protein product, partial [marine sediment metagenome]
FETDNQKLISLSINVILGLKPQYLTHRLVS